MVTQCYRVGLVPIHYASSYGHKDVVEYLISQGADPSIKGLHGNIRALP